MYAMELPYEEMYTHIWHMPSHGDKDNFKMKEGRKGTQQFPTQKDKRQTNSTPTYISSLCTRRQYYL